MSNIKFSGLASGLDTDNIIKELMKVERMKVDRVKKEKTRVEWKKDIWKEMNTKLYSFYTKSVFKLRSRGTFSKKDASVSQPDKVNVTANVNAPKGLHTIEITQLASGSFLTSDALSDDFEFSKTAAELDSTIDADNFDIKISINGNQASPTYKTISINKSDSVETVLRKISEQIGDEININYDQNNKRFFINTKDMGADKQIKLDGDPNGIKLLSKLGFASEAKREGSSGSDATYKYNNVDYNSDSNEVNINGLSIKLLGKTTGKSNITVTQNSEEIYDEVKDFIKEYNNLLAEMNEKVNADRAKGYEPLTAEEKKGMSEDEVKLWEEKIKKSLLRRDGMLTNVRDSMRSILTNSSGVDTSGFEYDFLSDLGIVTGDYEERGLLHINGDEDDSLYAIKDNKLKEAIEENPEKVAELLNALGDKLYSTMQEQMKSTEISSALTFFNDKNMTDKIDDYEDEIYTLEQRLIKIEERYYAQFTAMEQAIQQMNNQSASLASMLGGGQ
jgi:flagellar hook-associated protein 2